MSFWSTLLKGSLSVFLNDFRSFLLFNFHWLVLELLTILFGRLRIYIEKVRDKIWKQREYLTI